MFRGGDAMRIDDVVNQRDLAHMGLGLTESEAVELRNVLNTLLGDPEPRHEHVSSEDYGRELTIWIIRE
jgi:hypothetical protein